MQIKYILLGHCSMFLQFFFCVKKLFREKIFNKYFTSQCTTIDNDRTRPSSFNYLTDDRLCPFSISSYIIFPLIKSLGPNNVRGRHDFDFISNRDVEGYFA